MATTAIFKQDFSCKYANHPCELRTEQMSKVKRKDKILEWLKSLFVISEKNFISYWYLRSKGAVEMEIGRQKSLRQWYIFHPFSMIRLIWGLFTSVLFIFSMVFIPFRCSFLNSFMAKYYYLVGRSVHQIHIGTKIQLVLCIIWIIDCFGNFCTGYYDHATGEIVLSPKQIFRRYIIYFFIDLSSSLPIDYIIVLFSGMETYASISSNGFLAIQLYAMYSVIRFRPFFVAWYRLSNINKRWTHLFRLLSGFVIYYFIVSWSICLNMFIPEMTFGSSMYNDSKNYSWIEGSELLKKELHEQFALALINAFHHIIGVMTTWVNLYTAEDFLMAMVVMITCKMYWVYFLIVVLQSVTSSNALLVRLHLMQNQLKAYMKRKDYPAAQKKRLSRYYLYRFRAQNFSNRAILPLFPKTLRKEICMYTCYRLLHDSQLFTTVPKVMMLRLTQRMTKEMYFPWDVIIQGNTYGDSMYFICAGVVVVSTVSGLEICTLKDGEFFGEVALISQEKRRTATVTAIAMTELNKLEFQDFKLLIAMYPDVYSRLEKYALERQRIVKELEGRVG